MTDPGWGRAFLVRCDIDPDDLADIRAAYESCRDAHAQWMASGEGEMDGETYYMLVDAIKDLMGWEYFPLDWPGPTLVMLAQPLRNLIPRVKADGA